VANVFQVGAGMVGSAIAIDLSKDHNLFLADYDLNALKTIQSKNSNIQISQLDVTDSEALSEWIAPADIVLLAVPGFLGYKSLKTIINCGKDVVDISFSPENILTLDQLAKEKNVTAIVDAGVAPGIPNFLLGYWNAKMKINSFDYCVGGLPKNPSPPYNYKAPFSPIDVIEEYTRPARMMVDSKVITKAALTDLEIFHFSEVGKLEAFNTDGLRSLLKTMKHIPNMKEKTLRYPGHAKLMQSMIDEGLFDNNNFDDTVKKLFKDWKLEENEPEFTVLDINIYGDTKNIHYHLYDEMDIGSKNSSMARTTGYTATATINMLLKNLWDKKGVYPPEKVGANANCVEFLLSYLSDRNVKMTQT
tara:strand:- start:10560 stop:11642 length:1083 start_codon:yes stop_codon:yes gene_type:complete